MSRLVIEVHAGIGVDPVYLYRDEKGKLGTTVKFRNAVTVKDFTEGREQLTELMGLSHQEMRKVLNKPVDFTNSVIFLLQCWTRLDTGNPVVRNVQAQRRYQFNPQF